MLLFLINTCNLFTIVLLCYFNDIIQKNYDSEFYQIVNMTPQLDRKRGSSVSFTRAKDDSEDAEDEIHISLAPYIQTYLAHSGQGLGCCGVSLPVPFERAAPRSWWNPRFDSEILEEQFKRSAFPQIRLRFRFVLV